MSTDLYRHCLDKNTLDERPKYRHIKYQAHDEEKCKGEHDKTSPPWPVGCLIDPHRLPWRDLETIKHNNPRTFAVMYQQEDGDTVGGLADPIWFPGGTDAEGYPAPGCFDRERTIGEVPVHLRDGRGWSFVTVDPSPTEWWGVIWWVYDPETRNRYAIDIIRRRMNPEHFISLDLETYEFSGLCVDLRQQANEQGCPITHIVVEVNAAQRWLLQQPHVQKWQEVTGIAFVPHTTTVNKQDPKFGLESIGDLFRQGFIRLPYATPTSRLKVAALVSEATKYPDGDTTDLIMSTWFGKLAVENLWTPRAGRLYRRDVPDWISRDANGRTPRRGMASYA